jgi:hypothetical protein
VLSHLGLTPLRSFWAFFVVLAVWLQLHYPGMDFFAPGILLCLQHERMDKVLLLTVLAVLIQEGSGPLVFGAGILRYGSLIALFVLGRNLFEVLSPVFILLLGLVLAFLNLAILHTMASLQSLIVPVARIATDSVFSLGVFFVGWSVLFCVYRMVAKHEPLA